MALVLPGVIPTVSTAFGRGRVPLTQCWGLLQLLPMRRLPLYTLGPTNRAFSNSKPLQQAHVGGMKSVLVGVLKRWKMASATVLGFFFQRAVLAGTSLALMSQMGIFLKEGSRETRTVSVVGNSTQGSSSGARAEDAWRRADSTPVL